MVGSVLFPASFPFAGVAEALDLLDDILHWRLYTERVRKRTKGLVLFRLVVVAVTCFSDVGM